MTSVMTFDLVLQTDKDRWLIYTCSSAASTVPEYLSRLSEDWSKLKRNHYGASLPDLVFEHKITTHHEDGRQSLTKFACPPEAATQIQVTEDQTQNKRVLVIDDELEVASAIESRLQASGYDVSTAHDGEAGLDAVQNTKPDAILLDVRMPKMDGLTVLSHLKSNPATASTPVIILSASLNDKQRVLDCGASFFIQKPFQSNSILAALDAAMQ